MKTKTRNSRISHIFYLQETPETISVFQNIHRTDNSLESFHKLLKSEIMGHTNFVRFYLGLRKIEKTKARDAKLAKDSGGASKPKQSPKAKVRDKFIFDASSQLNMGKINVEDFLNRVTSEQDKICQEIDNCSVAPLAPCEIDELPLVVVQEASSESHVCQFCNDAEPVVALSCGCQQLCVDCFKEYAMTYTNGRQRDLTPDGNPLITSEFPMKCPHCRNMVTYYIITRR